MQETWVQSLDWEDPLEKGMATHSSILAWRIPWTEEPGGRVDTTEQLTHTHTHTHTHTQGTERISPKVLCDHVNKQSLP